MAIARVQESSELTVTSGTTGNVTLTVSSGNLLIAYIACQSGTATFTVSDNKGNTWNEAITKADGTVARSASLWYANNVSAGSTQVTVGASGSATYSAIIQEVSGQDTAGGAIAPLDASSSHSDTSATTNHVSSASSTVIDTTDAALVACSGIVTGSVGVTVSPGTGYTQIVSANVRILWQYKVFTGATNDEQGAWMDDSSRTAVAVIGAFKQAAGGGGGGSRVWQLAPLGSSPSVAGAIWEVGLTQ